LVLGAQATVTGAVSIAGGLGVDEVLIGITIVAFGTCLPELTIAIFSALKRRPDLAMGNALGSVAFNTLVVLGAGALVSGRLEVPASVLLSGILPMLGIVLVPVLLIQRNGRLGRRAGAMMVSIYACYVAFLVLVG
jgi:cation:H+ antiporter